MAIRFTQTVDLGNQRITSVSSPAVGTDAVNKDYVDNVAQGLDWKESVRAASTGDIDLSAPGATIDGVILAADDRFLAKDQTDPITNGVYVFNGVAAAAVRAPDADADVEVSAGMAVSVEEGAVNAGKTYVLVAPVGGGDIVLGTSDLIFTLLAGGGGTVYQAGAGLALTGGDTFNVNAGAGITADATSTRVNAGVGLTADATSVRVAAGNGLIADATDLRVNAGTGLIVDATNLRADPAYLPPLAVGKFSANVGGATSFTVTHNLNTFDVAVEVYDNAGTKDTIYCEVQRPTMNSVTLVFGSAPAVDAYRVVVHG